MVRALKGFGTLYQVFGHVFQTCVTFQQESERKLAPSKERRTFQNHTEPNGTTHTSCISTETLNGG